MPFTADDFVFWFEEVYSNKELVPTPLSVMSINGKPIAVKKVDASTVQFLAPDPYYALPTVLASVWGIGHHARFGRNALGGFAPAHYLKQFHPEVRVERRYREEARGPEVRQLGADVQESQRRVPQPGSASRDGRGRRCRRSTRRRGSWSVTPTASGSTPTAISCRTSIASA